MTPTPVPALAILAVVLGTSSAPAEEVSAELGATVFAAHCASCHGADATGNGPMAELLAIPAPDLTTLAARHGGTFPLAYVVEMIDGQTPIRAHGGPMPVFGPILSGESGVLDAPDGTPVMGDARILSLAAWLATVQR